MMIRSTPVPKHALALLDTSCVIDFPAQLEKLAEAAAVSTLSIAELAYGIHHGDPLVAAAREARYRNVLNTFDPVPYSAGAAHLYGAIAASHATTLRWPATGSGPNGAVLKFAMLEGVTHQFPNGTNNPNGFAAAPEFWDFLRDYRTP